MNKWKKRYYFQEEIPELQQLYITQSYNNCTLHREIQTSNTFLVIPRRPKYAIPVAPEFTHISPTSSALHR